MSYQDFPPPRGPAGPGPYVLTRDEKRVLKECNQESFYRRCIPFMTTLGLGAYYGVHFGYLKPNANYGAAPKVTAALVLGFITGKLSYKRQCEDKILRLPGGKLKESVLSSRKVQDRLWGGGLNDGGVYKDASISYALPPYSGSKFDAFEDHKPALGTDVDRAIDTFDDSFRIRSEITDESENSLPSVPPSQSVSYDELRYRNREEYDNRRRQYRPGPVDDYSPFNGPYPPVSPSAPARLETEDRSARSSHVSDPYGYTAASTRNPPQRKNFYGDIIEK